MGGIGLPRRDQARSAVTLYSGFSHTLELDHAYYGMPKAANLDKILITGGPDLAFAINAYRQQRKIFTKIPKVKITLLHSLLYQ
jgi:uncharacterized protein YecE (DUF72 family)